MPYPPISRVSSSAMASTPYLSFLFLPFLLFSLINARIFTFPMHHRYSDHLKFWSFNSTTTTHRHHHHHLHHWPVKGTVDYYADLARRDRLFRGRKISEIEEPLSFSDGNSSVRISSLGYLHYTTVTIGTPGMKFLVALDTGSDLFWVPCDCTRCAPIHGTSYAPDFELSIYNPKESTTGKKISCNNHLCSHRGKCLGTSSHCPYVISYVSAETSTSGILMEDVLHLTTEDRQRELVEAYITFGCGQVQTGSFLDVAAPNGLFGLGMENISVPSILSKEGFTADSFSMCFGRDGVGRISFGDKGNPDQKETPFNLNPLHPTYNVSVTQISVGTTISDVNFTVLFDSGTSFTYLVDPAYSKLSRNFDLQVKAERRPVDSRLPFEYCYNVGPDSNTSSIPSMSLIMKGGSQYIVYEPVIVISTKGEVVYCLAVVKSTELNIIGQNFMTGYRIVFDREKYTLGWQTSDCYDIQFVTPSVENNATVVPPAIAAQPDNETVTSTRSMSHISKASLTFPFHSCKGFTLLALFVALIIL